jgi:uncharacterized phiE125 gp8 family phage protein
MALRLKTAAIATPVTDAALKSHARITDGSEDADVAALNLAATRAAEVATQRALMPQTWVLTLDQFPRGGVIDVPVPPLISVTSLKYLDVDGVLTTLSSADYVVDNQTEPGRIVPAYEKTWPAIQLMPNAVTIEFVAGYANAAAVPDPIKHAIKMIFGHYWIHREEAGERQMYVTPVGAKHLLDPYRVYSFGRLA